MNTFTKKKHIKNNKTSVPFPANKNHLPVPVQVSTSKIPVITLTKKINSEFLLINLQRVLRWYPMIL